MPSKNSYTEAILSVVDEYKVLLKESAKKQNQTPQISGGESSDILIQKMLDQNNLSLDEFRRP